MPKLSLGLDLKSRSEPPELRAVILHQLRAHSLSTELARPSVHFGRGGTCSPEKRLGLRVQPNVMYASATTTGTSSPTRAAGCSPARSCGEKPWGLSFVVFLVFDFSGELIVIRAPLFGWFGF